VPDLRVRRSIGVTHAAEHVPAAGAITDPAPPSSRRRLRRPSPATVVDLGFLPAVLVVLVVVLSLVSPYFLTVHNVVNILSQTAVLGIVAAGTTFVIIGGDLDLSVGANVALSGVVAAYGMTSVTHSIAVGVLLGLAVGLGFGLVNGLVSTYLQVPSFITTLGMMVIGDGVAVSLSSGAVVGGLPSGFSNLSNADIGGISSIAWLMVAVFVVGYLILHRTGFGLRTYAVGGNRQAARLSGLRVERIRIANFVLCALAASIGGLALAAQVQAGQPDAGTIYTLYGTAAVVLGGTSLYGGRGGMVRTVFGVVLIGALQNGLDLLGVSYSNQQVAVGIVFILAASSELLRRRVAAASRPSPATGVASSVSATLVSAPSAPTEPATATADLRSAFSAGNDAGAQTVSTSLADVAASLPAEPEVVSEPPRHRPTSSTSPTSRRSAG
jgi:ribose transport system permease protein